MSRTPRRNILITGASSGIGRGMAREFAARGRNLALAARRTERLEELRGELLAAHPQITVAIRKLDVDVPDEVFGVFREFDDELGGLDRVIVNAGLGKGQPLGHRLLHANVQTARTNFLGALAQSEAALELFRPRNAGHVVLISSVSAMRGMPATSPRTRRRGRGCGARRGHARGPAKTGIDVSTIFPGFIRSEINEKVKKVPFIVDTETGCRALAAAIEKEPHKAYVPAWPWLPVSMAMKVLPLSVVSRMA